MGGMTNEQFIPVPVSSNGSVPARNACIAMQAGGISAPETPNSKMPRAVYSAEVPLCGTKAG